MYTIFITNNHASFHLWWKQNLVKQQEAMKIKKTMKILDSMMKIRLSVKSRGEYLIETIMVNKLKGILSKQTKLNPIFRSSSLARELKKKVYLITTPKKPDRNDHK